MTQRTVRIGELLLRELGVYMHGRWGAESVNITLTDMSVSPDLHNARVYYSVIGGREDIAKAGKFLMKIRRELRTHLSKVVVLKRMPELSFMYDPVPDRGARLMEIFDELDNEESK